jgi:hypothetical protein
MWIPPQQPETYHVFAGIYTLGGGKKGKGAGSCKKKGKKRKEKKRTEVIFYRCRDIFH